MTGTTWNDGDDWESELSRPDGFPLVAMLVGSGVIILVAALVFNLFDIDVAGHLVAPLCLAILGAGAVFGAAWLLTLRHATLGWNVLAGGVFAGVALMTVVVALAADIAAVRADAAAIGLIKINAAGEPVLPRGVKGGPATAAAMTYVRAAIVERHHRESVLRQLGIDRLTNARAIESDPSLVRDCGRFNRAKSAIDVLDRRLRDIVQRFRRDIDRLVTEQVAHDAALRGLDEGQTEGFANLGELDKMQQAQLDRAGPLCTLLASRRWKSVGNTFMFSTRGDLASFARIIGPWNDTVRREQAFIAQRNQEMRETGMVDDPSRL